MASEQIGPAGPSQEAHGPKSVAVAHSVTQVRAAALSAHELSYNVLPIVRGGSKKPALSEWKEWQEQPQTLACVAQWFGEQMRVEGLALICGTNDLECLDLDEAGILRAFTEACDSAGIGALWQRIQDGYLEETPGDGRFHVLYRCSATQSTKLARTAEGGTRIETKGRGGYVIVAPSGGAVHETGRPYKLVSGGLDSIERLTEDERAQLHAVARSFDEERQRVKANGQDAIGKGSRNETLFRIGRSMRGRGEPFDSIHDELANVNSERCKPPLSEEEVEKIAASAAGYEPNAPTPEPECGWFELPSTRGVRSMMVDFLWYPFIVKNTTNVWSGEGGIGKGVSLGDLVARWTRGDAMPDGGSPSRPLKVLWLSGEDRTDDTILPRLRACGVDEDRVWVMDVASLAAIVHADDPDKHGLELERDEKIIVATLKHYGVDVVVLDPVSDFVGPDFRDGDQTHVRDLLGSCDRISVASDVTIVAIRHPSKDRSVDSKTRVAGSAAWVNKSRSVVFLAQEEQDEDGDGDGRPVTYLRQVKRNLSPDTGLTMSFTIQQAISPETAGGDVVTQSIFPRWEKSEMSRAQFEAISSGNQKPVTFQDKVTEALGKCLPEDHSRIGSDELKRVVGSWLSFNYPEEEGKLISTKQWGKARGVVGVDTHRSRDGSTEWALKATIPRGPS